MQLLALIASFIFGRMNNVPKGGGIRETARELFDDAILKGRTPAMLILAGLSAVIFFCGGLFITILESTMQYDRVGYVTLSATLGAGIVLFFVAALGFAYVFAYAWPGASRQIKEAVKPEQEHHASTLEQALTVLVLDFVKDREVRREREMREQATASSPTAPAYGAPRTNTSVHPASTPSSSPIH